MGTTAPGTNLRINGARLWDSLAAMAAVGPGVRGGNNRQTLTDADGEGRHLFRDWCAAAGLTVAVDSMGNMFARRAGTEPDLAPVMVGSHLDTQPTGGRFDGVLGVLGALELVRTLNELGVRTRRPIEVVNWTNEEGARFAPAMAGSGVFAGVFEQDRIYACTDGDGVSLGAELARLGFRGDEPAGGRALHAYFELHIEQGPILEDEGVTIGVVTHGQGLRWLQVTLTGRESHSGTTPMASRRNAALGLARVIQLADRIAWHHAPQAVATVGHAEIHPNSRNIVPGRVVLTADLRNPDAAVLVDMADRFTAGVAEIADSLGLGHAIEEVAGFAPVTFDPDCVAAVRAAADRLGHSHRDIVSGAGHDACWINRIAPTAMVMCPCVDGLSHNEDEDIRPDWATAGADVLMHAVVDTAGIVAD